MYMSISSAKLQIILDNTKIYDKKFTFLPNCHIPSLGTRFVIWVSENNIINNDKNKKRYNYGKSNWN